MNSLTIHRILALSLLGFTAFACQERPLPIPPSAAFDLDAERAFFTRLAPAKAPVVFRLAPDSAPATGTSADGATHRIVFDEVFAQNARNTPNTEFEISARWRASLQAPSADTGRASFRVVACEASTTPKSPELEEALCDKAGEPSLEHGGAARTPAQVSPVMGFLDRLPVDALDPDERRAIPGLAQRGRLQGKTNDGDEVSNKDAELRFAGVLVEGERRYPVLQVEFSSRGTVISTADRHFKGELAAVSDTSAALIFNEDGAGLRSLRATSVLRLSGPVQTLEGDEIDHIQQCVSTRTSLVSSAKHF